MKKPAPASHGPEHAIHTQIAQRAYALWEEAGQPEGKPERFWLQAERELGISPSAYWQNIASGSTSNASAQG